MTLRPEVRAKIFERLQSGERARDVARDWNISAWTVYGIAWRRGLKLRRGARPARSLAERHLWFDQRHGAGAALRLIELARTMRLREVGQVFGRTKAWAHAQFHRLDGRRDELHCVGERYAVRLRPDVTIERILEVAPRCQTKEEIAQRLGCGMNTIYHRLRHAGLTLPKRYQPPLKRPDITAERVRWAAGECRSVLAMTNLLGVSNSTITRRANVEGITLPNGRVAPRPATLERLAYVQALLAGGATIPEIAPLLGVTPKAVRAFLRRHRRHTRRTPGRRRETSAA